MEEFYTIGDASEIVGLPASTIRFYEKKRVASQHETQLERDPNVHR